MTIGIRDLVVSYGRMPIVEAESLTLQPGEITALIDPNGVGKSPLLKAIAGLIPAEGGVEMDDHALSKNDRHDVIAYMPQKVAGKSS